jgi:hypothetical protein
MSPLSALQNLAGWPSIRTAIDIGMSRYARHRVAQLDRRSAAALQQQTLLRLVRSSRHTRFGRDHDFGRIRSIADYQSRVPLRDYDAFWSHYWREPFPHLHNVTWPGAIGYFALSSGTTTGSTKYIPLSRAMLASNQRAAWTTLSLFLAAYPGTPLFRGRLFFLGGSTDLQDLTQPSQPRVLAGDLSGIIACEAPSLLRPYTFPPLDLALLKDWDEKMDLLARRSASLPITMLSGVPSWLLLLFDRLKQVTGKTCIAEVWPDLRLVLHGGTRFEPYRNLFQKEIGSPAVRFLDVYAASEGYLAAEDPRHELLRLLPDHHIFFEFVPVQELGQAQPTRHGVANLEVGVQYAVVVTTCAGLWSYILGDTVCFERREPPLLRFTGRTRHFLSAFGEHLISEEVEQAVATAAQATHTDVIDFHVGPVFPQTPRTPGHHRYLVEFVSPPPDLACFGRELDASLCRLNEDYDAHRRGDLTLRAPEVVVVRRGGFAAWMRAKGKLGGQHKVPRLDNSGQITSEIDQFLAKSH